jgi:hypothetical protein
MTVHSAAGGVVALHLDAASRGIPFKTREQVIAYVEPILLGAREWGNAEYSRAQKLWLENIKLAATIRQLKLEIEQLNQNKMPTPYAPRSAGWTRFMKFLRQL